MALQDQQQQQKHVETNTHFADPTIAASLKSTAPLQNPFTSQPGRSLSAPLDLPTRLCFVFFFLSLSFISKPEVVDWKLHNPFLDSKTKLCFLPGPTVFVSAIVCSNDTCF